MGLGEGRGGSVRFRCIVVGSVPINCRCHRAHYCSYGDEAGVHDAGLLGRGGGRGVHLYLSGGIYSAVLASDLSTGGEELCISGSQVLFLFFCMRTRGIGLKRHKYACVFKGEVSAVDGKARNSWGGWHGGLGHF